ncbi:MAG: pilus assembly protein PilM [Candidatus Omnitrophica bacterium]|nr:pilus assembly protein PilM [Candidatus Omnitrophota bacterium]
MAKGIGIYIGQKEVVAVSLALSKGSPILDRFAIESIGDIPVSGGAAAAEKKKTSWINSLIPKKAEKKVLTPVAKAIERTLEKIGARDKGRVIAAFNPFHVVTRYFEMPAIPKREWEGAAAYEAGRYIPFKLSEVIIDYRIAEAKGQREAKTLSVTASAAKTDVLRSHVNHLRQASAMVDMVEPVFCAFSRALALAERLESDQSHGYLFLDSDGGVNLTLERNGIVYLSRDFLLSEDRKANETRFYEELKASFDFMNRLSGARAVERVYLAGTGDLIFWTDFLTSVFGKEVHFEFALFPTKQDIPKNVLCALFVPIGLAMRALKYKSPLGDLSLLPPVERETKPERLRRKLGVEFLIIALFFIVLRVLVLEPYVLYARRQIHHEAISQSVQDPSLLNLSMDELRMLHGDLKQQERQLTLFSKQKVALGTKLKRLAQTIPSSIWLEQITYRRAEPSSSEIAPAGKGSLSFEGHCYLGNPQAEVKAINDWANALGLDQSFLGGFNKVTVTEVRRDRYFDRDTSTFRIQVE